MNDTFDNIPEEMKAIDSWVCWRYENRNLKKPTKIPYSPLTGHKAVVTDPSTWTSYVQAVHAMRTTNHYSGIGFVLSQQDPYTFIDLDDPDGDAEAISAQVKIFDGFNSYSERSPSGNGLHIIVKGDIINGKRRGKVELYNDQRYMTMTGNVYAAKPISNHQDKLSILWTELGGATKETIDSIVDRPATISDDVLLTRAANAENGEKFSRLWHGQWQYYYSSQSEADFAIIDIISFYSRNVDQTARLFHSSSLGQRDKAKRATYLNPMIIKAFSSIPPDVDIIGLKDRFDKLVAEKRAATEPQSLTPAGLPTTEKEPGIYPQGMMGDIARFIYAAAPRPVKEMALMGAIALMAGVAGRTYTISNTGLNQYLLMLASTGTGKEGMASGIDRLLSAIKSNCPAASEFRGPSSIASGQALTKYIASSPCFVSIVGEFGLTMQRLSSPRRSQAEITLKQTLLDLWAKSGPNQTLQSSIYADKEKSTKAIDSPSLTLLGESTPTTLYEALDEDLISDGLLPRFLIIEYTGGRPPRSESHDQVVPSDELVASLQTLCTNALEMAQQQQRVTVGMSLEAKQFCDDIDRKIDKQMNEADNEIVKELWNRVHLKLLRLSALVAVGRDMYHPVVQLEDAEWAYNLMADNVKKLADRFEQGRIGAQVNEANQMEELFNAIKKYLTWPVNKLYSYVATPELHAAKIVSYGTVHKMLAKRAAFRKDRIGATNAIKRAINVMVESGDLQEVPHNTLWEKYSKTGKAYVVTNLKGVLDGEC